MSLQRHSLIGRLVHMRLELEQLKKEILVESRRLVKLEKASNAEWVRLQDQYDNLLSDNSEEASDLREALEAEQDALPLWQDVLVNLGEGGSQDRSSFDPASALHCVNDAIRALEWLYLPSKRKGRKPSGFLQDYFDALADAEAKAEKLEKRKAHKSKKARKR